MSEDDWLDFPVILGQGSLHDLSDRDDPPPRLSGLRSVSRAAMEAMSKRARKPARPAGFLRLK